MSEYGTTPLARALVDDRSPMDRTLEMAESVWHQRRKIYLDPDDPQLSPLHRDIAIQIATQRYGRRRDGSR